MTKRDFFTGATSNDYYSCDDSRDRCGVVVVGSAPVVLWNLTADHTEAPDLNQQRGNSTVRGIPERFLLPLIMLSQEKILPWCDPTIPYWTSATGPRVDMGVTNCHQPGGLCSTTQCRTERRV